MLTNQRTPVPNLGRTSDSDMLSGRLGVFADSWKEVKEPPAQTGVYLVGLRSTDVAMGFYVKGAGWEIGNRVYIGEESPVAYWMTVPEVPRGER